MFFIKYFYIPRVIPSADVPERSDQDERSRCDVKRVLDQVVVVQPAVSLLIAGFSPQQARFVEDVAEHNWTRNYRAKLDDRGRESEGNRFVPLFNASQSNQEVCCTFSPDDKLVDAHGDQKNVKIFQAINGTGTRVC